MSANDFLHLLAAVSLEVVVVCPRWDTRALVDWALTEIQVSIQIQRWSSLKCRWALVGGGSFPAVWVE